MRLPDLSTAANVAQILSVIVPAVFAFVTWRITVCHVTLCHRHGRNKVAGTSVMVCNKHHTKEWHEKIYKHVQTHHPDRMAHGDDWTEK